MQDTRVTVAIHTWLDFHLWLSQTEILLHDKTDGFLRIHLTQSYINHKIKSMSRHINFCIKQMKRKLLRSINMSVSRKRYLNSTITWSREIWLFMKWHDFNIWTKIAMLFVSRCAFSVFEYLFKKHRLLYINKTYIYAKKVYKIHWKKCFDYTEFAFWWRPNRIFGYHNWIRFFIARTFNRLNYKDLVNPFWLNL